MGSLITGCSHARNLRVTVTVQIYQDMRTLLRTRNSRRVRTPRRVQVQLSQRVVHAAGLHQEKYVISTVHLEYPEKSAHPANGSADTSEKHSGAVREKTTMHFVPVNWLSREITSFLLDSEMEERMKPESAIRNENEVRAAAPAPSMGVAGGHHGAENFPAPATTLGDERADWHEKIQARAYELFLERGTRDGGDITDWLDAEQELQAAQSEKSFRTAAGGKSN